MYLFEIQEELKVVLLTKEVHHRPIMESWHPHVLPHLCNLFNVYNYCSQKQTNTDRVFYTKIHPVRKGNSSGKLKTNATSSVYNNRKTACLENNHSTCICGVALVAGPIGGMSTPPPPPPTPPMG